MRSAEGIVSFEKWREIDGGDDAEPGRVFAGCVRSTRLIDG